LNSALIIRALGVWFVLVIAAIFNGTFRVAVLSPNLNEQLSHILSTVMLIVIIFIITGIFVSKLKKVTKNELWITGLIWVAATLIFEFIFGHYVMGHSWEKLIADYNFLKGRFFLLIIISTLVSPYIAGKILKK